MKKTYLSGNVYHFIYMDSIQPDNAFHGLVYKNPSLAVNVQASLVVPPGWKALVYKMGMLMDTKDEGTYAFTAQNFPMLAMMGNLNAAQVEMDVFFVRSSLSKNKWGTSNPIRLFDNTGGIADVRAFGT
ncbi:MAG TPA: SPFH domain-containing protein, partial [Flavobacteriales bacterium]|nr:SPFH domain-containing protein [Flavobacteriales bacterium]